MKRSEWKRFFEGVPERGTYTAKRMHTSDALDDERMGFGVWTCLNRLAERVANDAPQDERECWGCMRAFNLRRWPAGVLLIDFGHVVDQGMLAFLCTRCTDGPPSIVERGLKRGFGENQRMTYHGKVGTETLQ